MQAGEDSPDAVMRDPVCGRQVAREGTLLVAEHDGRTYPFCSDRCRMLFALHPEAFTVDGARPAGDTRPPVRE